MIVPLLHFWAVKSALIILLAGFLDFLLRARSAGARRAIWGAAVLCVASLPFLELALPHWSAVLAADESTRLYVPTELMTLAMIWSLGAATLSTWMVVGWIERIRVSNSSVRADSLMHAVLIEAAGSPRVARGVRLIVSNKHGEPVTWGWPHATICLPAVACAWPRAVLRRVLVHELAHVRAADSPIRTLARVLCAVQWFNPLVWLAKERLIDAQERAVDQSVLHYGEDPRAYSATLLELARDMYGPLTGTGIPLASRTGAQLERRLLAILDPAPRPIARAASVSLVVILALAAVVLATGRLDYKFARSAESPAVVGHSEP